MRLEASAAAALRLGMVSVETRRTGTLGSDQDLEGDLDQYLGEGTEGEGPVPWAVGNDAVPRLCRSESWWYLTMPGGRTTDQDQGR